MLQDLLAKRGFHLIAPERCDLKSRYLEPAGLSDRPLGDVERVAIATSARQMKRPAPPRAGEEVDGDGA
jgi:hypothetical protein